MAEAAAVAGVASVASLAMSSGSDFVKGSAAASAGDARAAADIAQGEGTQAADQFQAQRAEQAAEFGKAQASLTDTTMRENMNSTLGNIMAIRAAANIDPSSPTTAAVLDRNEAIADRQRTASVLSINAQNADDLATAAYLKQAGDFAVRTAQMSAGADQAAGQATEMADFLSGGSKLFGGLTSAFKPSGG